MNGPRDPLPDVAAYPRDAHEEQRLLFALRFAALAPSSHNSQPWRFRVEEGHVDVLVDRARALPVVDPEDRELVMSCGAALHHLRTALAAFGEVAETRLMPYPGVVDVVGRVDLRGRTQSDARALERLAAAARRRTIRLPFEATTVTARALDRVWEAVREEGAELHVLERDAKDAVVRLVVEADHEQMGSAPFRRELASWMHGNRSLQRDGMPGYADGLDDAVAAVAPLVVRTFDMGKSRGARDAALAEHSPILVLVATQGDSVLHRLRAGQALSALLLDATVLGLSASFLNQPIEVPRLRGELAQLFGQGTVPQLLLRLGSYSGELPGFTPRRPLADVLV